MISDLGFSFLDCNSKFLDRILIFFKSKVESWFWLNIIHVLLCLASIFVFCFFCASEFPFLILYAHNVKKKTKGYTRRLPHRNVIIRMPSLQKKKKKKVGLKTKKKSVSLCSLLFVSISNWVFFSCISFVLRICDCVRLIWIWLGFRFWVFRCLCLAISSCLLLVLA